MGVEVTVLVGPVWVVAVLLVLAGAGKLATPEPTVVALRSADLPGHTVAVRVLGVVEVAAGTLLVWGGGAAAAAVVAVLYAGFAGFLVRLRGRAGDGADCSCLGPRATPVTRLHLGVDLMAAGAALAAVAAPLPPARLVLASSPWQGVPTVVALALTVVLLRLLLRELPIVLRDAGRLATPAEVSP